MLAKITLGLGKIPVWLLAFHFVCFSNALDAQLPKTAAAPDLPIRRIAGVESTSGIEYVRLILSGKSVDADPPGRRKAPVSGASSSLDSDVSNFECPSQSLLHSAEFFTTLLLSQIRSEPLCKASLL